MATGKIAIPYYGNLTHPSRGFERIFFIIEHDAQRPVQQQAVSLGIWDAKQSPFLTSWLQDIGVKEVICSKKPDEKTLVTMINAGIKVLSGGSEVAKKLLKQLNIM